MAICRQLKEPGMQTETYTIDQYVTDIRAIVAEETEDRAITDRIKPLALKLAAVKDWFRDEYRTVNAEQGFGVHLLHEEPNHDLAVFVFAWEPGKGVGAHDHRTWAVVAGIEGQEQEVNFERLDDGSREGYAHLVPTHEATMVPGQVAACRRDDIHSVRNTGDEVSVSLHTYGRHINYTGRSVFDIEARREELLVVQVED